jgi:short subunit dehydrogenase-like uncharacterized protein
MPSRIVLFGATGYTGELTARALVDRGVLEGPNGYTLTGAFLAWGASRARDGGLQGTGALGPAEAFGLDRLEKGCAEAGLKRAT